MIQKQSASQNGLACSFFINQAAWNFAGIFKPPAFNFSTPSFKNTVNTHHDA